MNKEENENQCGRGSYIDDGRLLLCGIQSACRNTAPLLAERSQLILDKGLVCRTQVETAQARGFVQDVLNNNNGKLDDLRRSRLKMADDDLAEIQLVVAGFLS